MQKEDREEVRQILTDVLAGHMAKQDGQYIELNLKIDNLSYKVDEVKKGQGLMGDRLKDIETKPHPVTNCAQAAVIKELTATVAEMQTEKKQTMKVAAFVAAAIAVAANLLKFIFP
jgi:hypothetical protein